MASGAEENFRPTPGREPDKRAEEKHDQREPNATEAPKGSKLGELVPSEHEASEAAQTASELFHQAAGLDKMPEAGKSLLAAKTTEWQAQRSEGVSRAQNIAFANEQGEVKIGLQYTNNDGTFFKTLNGATFRVEPNEQKGFDLKPLNPGGEKFTATELRVVKDLFSAAPQDLATMFKARTQLAEPTVAAPTERGTPRENTARGETRAEAINFVPDVARNQQQEAVARVMLEFKQRMQSTANHLFDIELGNIRELSSIIKNLCTEKPDLGALLNLKAMLERNMGSAARQTDFSSGQLDFRPDHSVSTEYGIGMSSVLVNVINQFIETQRAERAIAAANMGITSQANVEAPKPIIEQRMPTSRNENYATTEHTAPPRPERLNPENQPTRREESSQQPEERRPEAPPEPKDEVEPPTPDAELETDLIPPVETPVAPGLQEDNSEFIAQQLIAQADAIEEDEEKARQELVANEEAERVERELIKQQIKKRDEERRKRYVVKDRDTLESIAVKQFKDVRLAKLIYEINKHLLPVKVIRGKQVRELKPRLVIFLPTNAEIDKFRQGAQATLDLSQIQNILDSTESSLLQAANTAFDTADSIISAAISGTTRSSEQLAVAKSDTPDSVETEIEPIDDVIAAEIAPEPQAAAFTPPEIHAEPPAVDDDHVSYTVRLGDTLKSIAIRQPQLLNPSLWVLLAQVNGLSTEVDASGSPTCKLTRGMRLKLPNRAEVEQFIASK